MTALILSVCLMADPSQCEERTVPLSDATLNQCMIGKRDIAAQWRGDNDEWRILSARCDHSGTGNEE